jgi:hypothetical protein
MARSGPGEVALLATIDRAGRPAVAPVCPIFANEGLYLLTASATPKVEQLRLGGVYTLHSQVGADDEEFAIAGRAFEVAEADRADVIKAIRFESFDARDPIFELMFERARAVVWPRPGESERFGWPAISPGR